MDFEGIGGLGRRKVRLYPDEAGQEYEGPQRGGILGGYNYRKPEIVTGLEVLLAWPDSSVDEGGFCAPPLSASDLWHLRWMIDTPPALRDDVKRIARAGRRGDTEIAHVTRGELVVPKAMQSPEVLAVLRRAAARHGVPLEKLSVGNARNSINPETGAPEFAFLGAWLDDLNGLFGPKPDREIGGIGTSFPVPNGGMPSAHTWEYRPDRDGPGPEVLFAEPRAEEQAPAAGSNLPNPAAADAKPEDATPWFNHPAQLDKFEGQEGHDHVYHPPGSGITTNNDDIKAPSPDRAVDSKLARMVEGAAEMGIDININSSTGGKHGDPLHPELDSHYNGNALDINGVAGHDIVPKKSGEMQADRRAIEHVKSYFMKQPDARTIIGPGFALQSDGTGGWKYFPPPIDKKTGREQHENHIHVETW